LLSVIKATLVVVVVDLRQGGPPLGGCIRSKPKERASGLDRTDPRGSGLDRSRLNLIFRHSLTTAGLD
jgi:hypothetical protein